MHSAGRCGSTGRSGRCRSLSVASEKVTADKHDARTPVWAIWGLIATFAVVQVVAWTIAGGVPRRPLVLVQVGAAWFVMLVLAWLASRRIETLSSRLSQKERAHLSTLDEVEQLQIQNAMLQIVALG